MLTACNVRGVFHAQTERNIGFSSLHNASVDTYNKIDTPADTKDIFKEYIQNIDKDNYPVSFMGNCQCLDSNYMAWK